jgi:uncharacterized protein
MPRRSLPFAPAFQELLSQRVSRRSVLQAGVALAPFAIAGCSSIGTSKQPGRTRGLSFEPIEGSTADAVILPRGYTHDLIVRWGESLASGVPDMDASALASGGLLKDKAAEWQTKQFGQNCDAIHFFPLDARGTHGLLCVNNEFPDGAVMFPGHPKFAEAVRGAATAYVRANATSVGVSQASVGVSVIEIAKVNGRWERVKNSRYARRITANTPIDISGPARGAPLMRTREDPEGVRALGTFGNCAGGKTPWGTYLTAEENVHDYFGNHALLQKELGLHDPTVIAHERFAMWSAHSLHGWEGADPRFDMLRNPTEPFRFGWIVEIDPKDPAKAPVKRTALGRFAHEGANPIIAPNGQVAVYMGDDAKFEYVYKFVSRRRFDAKDPESNRNLLDEGTLYVARFDAGGAGEWLPLVYDKSGPLNESSGFRDQADVLIRTRAAASVLGATPMDRPEDVEANPTTGLIYVSCTNNDARRDGPQLAHYRGREIDLGPNAANPRALNKFGHIIELREAGDDHTARTFTWEVFLLGGDASGGKLLTNVTEAKNQNAYNAGYTNASEVSPIGSPDNIGFDLNGNLWIVTDGEQPDGSNNGCWVCPTTGAERGRLKRFLGGPIGAEICGCEFTPDGETLFLSIQHPGAEGTVEEPISHWPDGPGTQPRSAVIAVRKEGGGRVGS